MGLELALENYNLLHRLWREDVVDWEGGFGTRAQRRHHVSRRLSLATPRSSPRSRSRSASR
jgi:hypothetical protein